MKSESTPPVPWLELQCKHQYASGFTLEISLQSSARVVVLMGPSGSGKTSLLMILAGLLKPTHGELCVRGQTWFHPRTREGLSAPARKVGLQFQEPRLFPFLNVRDNLLYAARRRQAGISVDQILSGLELHGLERRFPVSLSGGQQQRVALGRALLAAESMLLLDEPLAAVDTALKESILKLITQHAQHKQLPLVVATHDRLLAEELGGEVWQLQAGRLVFSKSPQHNEAS